jgi:hypothetical protein
MTKYLYFIGFTLIAVNSLQSQVIVKPKIVYELSGYSIQDAGKSKYLSDTTGGFVDPLHGVTTFPHPNNLIKGFPYKQYEFYYPDPALGYPGRRGNRVIFDLTGAIDANDTTHRWNLTNVYGYSITTEVPGDTLWFYNLDTMFTAPVQDRWKFLARPDSLLTPIGRLVTVGGGTGAWQSFTCNKNVRYLMVRANLFNRGAFLTTPDYFKRVLYGTPNYDTRTLPVRPPTWTGALPTKKNKTYGSFVGTNIGQGIDTLQTIYDGNIRAYGGYTYWDTTRAATVSILRYDYFPDIGPLQYQTYLRQGRKFYWSIKGTNSFVYDQSGGTSRICTDSFMQEPECPYNYAREAKFYYNYAAKHGSVAVSTANTIWDNNTTNGLNDVAGVENGNEPEGNGEYGLTYMARSWVDYDGYEGRVGTAGKCGVKNADPNFLMIQAGMVFTDTARVDMYIWFSKVMRTDGKFPFGAVNYHQYPRTTDTLDHTPSNEENVGAHGESPETDNIKGNDLAFAKSVFNSYGDTIKIFKTEYGYGNWGHPATTPTEAAFPWDFGNVPSISGLDSLQLKAVLMARSEQVMAFSPLNAYNEFFFHNSGFGDNIYLLFASYGRGTGRNGAFALTTLFQWYYYRAGIYSVLKNYYPDSLISSAGTNLWVTRWRKLGQTDSVVYVVWKGSYTASTLSSQTVNVGYIKGSTMTKVIPSFSSITPTTSSVSTSGQTLSIATVTEAPQLFFGQELPQQTLWIFPHPAVFKSN